MTKMLKHDLYRLERPVYIYDPNHPPFIPNVNVHESVRHLLPVISALVANKISLKSGDNVARTYHYNECSANNWANPDFAEAVKFSADNLALLLKDQPNSSLEELLEKAINESLIMLTSRKVFEIPEISNAISPMLKDAASKNVKHYQRKLAEIDRLYDSIGNGYKNDTRENVGMNQPNYPNMQPNIYQQPIVPIMQPGIYPQQFNPGMYPQPFINPGMMNIQQPFMPAGMYPQQPFMNPNMVPVVNPGFMPQNNFNYNNFQAPGYPRNMVPFNANQNRVFQQANYSFTPADQNFGLTENMSGLRHSIPIKSNENSNQSIPIRNNVNPISQKEFFNPCNQPNRINPQNNEFAFDYKCKPHPFDTPHLQPVNPTLNQNNQNNTTNESMVEKVTIDEWRSSDEQPYLRAINPLIEREEFHRINNKVFQVIIPLESPMNKEEQTIKMLGDIYKLDGVISNKRMRKLEEDAMNLYRISGNDILNSEEKPDEKVTAEKFPDLDVKQYVDPCYINDYFTDQALFKANLKFYEYNNQHRNNRTNVYRCFMAVNKPILTNDNYNDLVKELSKAVSFEDLCERIKSQGLLCYRNDSKENNLKHLSYINVLTNINKTLTDMVNDCLRYELSLPEVSIDSFVEDVLDLPQFLEDRYSPLYRDAFNEWERDVMRNLFVFHDEYESLRKGLLSEKDLESNIKVTFIPETYSATFINATFAELNLDFRKKDVLMLSSQSHRALYAIAKSLFQQKEEGARKSLIDYIITNDNIKLRLHYGYLANEAYLISKA